jgi:hypothetical protein
MVENITSGDVVQGEKETPIKVEGSQNYQKRARKNTKEINRAEQWIQVLVDILVEGKEYGITALPVNFQDDSALIRLPGLRVCSGSGSGRHLAFMKNMASGDSLCTECQKRDVKDDAKSSSI